MGSFVDFKCVSCGYELESIGFGHGKKETPFLKLYTCDACKSIGSTWIDRDNDTRCSVCYEKDLTLLDDASRLVNCPKCGQTATLIPKSETWE